MPLAIGFFILFMVTSLIIFYKDCEYLFSTIVGVLNFLLGPWSTEYTIYIPEDSFIQENYVIDLE